MDDTKERVFLLHNIVAPYRLPLFERLAERYDLHVAFCKTNRDVRSWDADPRNWSFRYTVLSHVAVGPFVLNLLLPVHLLTEEYDVYITGDNPEHVLTTLFVFLYAKLTRRPFVLWSGVIETEYLEAQAGFGSVRGLLLWCDIRFRSLYRRVLYGYVDGFIAYSSKTESHLIQRGVDPERIFVGGQIMPESCLASTDAAEFEPEDRFVVLFLGYLQRRKGVDDLIDAFGSLELTDAVLRIAGTGPDEDRLKSIASEHESVEFVGYVEGSEKSRCYATADVFVLPTRDDPWGLVINEALYYDCPVVVTEAAGSADLVRESGAGIIIEPDRPDQLHDAIHRLYIDDEERRRMRRNARRYDEGTSVANGVAPFDGVISYVTG